MSIKKQKPYPNNGFFKLFGDKTEIHTKAWEKWTPVLWVKYEKIQTICRFRVTENQRNRRMLIEVYDLLQLEHSIKPTTFSGYGFWRNY